MRVLPKTIIFGQFTSFFWFYCGSSKKANAHARERWCFILVGVVLPVRKIFQQKISWQVLSGRVQVCGKWMAFRIFTKIGWLNGTHKLMLATTMPPRFRDSSFCIRWAVPRHRLVPVGFSRQHGHFRSVSSNYRRCHKQQRRAFSNEFMREAVKLVLQPGASKAAIASDRTYGSQRIMRALRQGVEACSGNRVARLMRIAGIKARHKRRRMPGQH